MLKYTAGIELYDRLHVLHEFGDVGVPILPLREGDRLFAVLIHHLVRVQRGVRQGWRER